MGAGGTGRVFPLEGGEGWSYTLGAGGSQACLWHPQPGSLSGPAFLGGPWPAPHLLPPHPQGQGSHHGGDVRPHLYSLPLPTREKEPQEDSVPQQIGQGGLQKSWPRFIITVVVVWAPAPLPPVEPRATPSGAAYSFAPRR